MDLCHLLFGQKVRVLLIRMRQNGILLPQFRCQVSVRRTKGVKDGLDKVTHGTCMTTRTRVAIVDTGHVQQLLSGGRGHQSGTARSGDQSNADGTAFSSHLTGDGVGKSGAFSPVSTSDGSDVELGGGDGSANGGGDFGTALDSKSNVSGGVSDGDEGLESSTLTGRRLLLHGHDLHDLVLKFVLQKVVNDLGLLDGDGKEKDLFDASDLSVLDETSKLGYGDPDVFVTTGATSTSSAATAASTASATASAAKASSAGGGALSGGCCWGCFVAHDCYIMLCYLGV
mmetsp:Transcript_12386/g.19548  ORF Transcript_12386/g.19548 Transcript_12386/m.19548 type:complete len:285 (-) Transcript_12386:58-912(-)